MVDLDLGFRIWLNGRRQRHGNWSRFAFLVCERDEPVHKQVVRKDRALGITLDFLSLISVGAFVADKVVLQVQKPF